jgi:threonyl-tRNA synthetase
MGARIRESELMKIPVMFILGEREEQNRQVSIRRRKQGDLGQSSWTAAIDMIVTENKNKE